MLDGHGLMSDGTPDLVTQIVTSTSRALPWVHSVYGGTFVDNLLFMQRREPDEFDAHVAEHASPGDASSDWEIRRYRAVI